MTVEESYTSKTSFLDEEKLHSYKDNKPTKGYVIHADINASFNIIRKVSGDVIYNFIDKVSIKGSNPKRWKINIQ